MAEDIFHLIGQGIRRVIKPVTGLLKRYRQDRQTRKALVEAYGLDQDGKYAEAAAASRFLLKPRSRIEKSSPKPFTYREKYCTIVLI